MRNRFEEDKVSFWLDYRGYREKMEGSIEDRMARAQKIYVKYIVEGAQSDINLDKLARLNITQVLKISNEQTVHQRDEIALRRAFDAAHEKIFNEVRA